MGGPSIPDKRWSVDLEKRIQHEHYEQGYEDRYAFDSKSEREIFIIDTPLLTQAELGILERLLNTV